MFFASHTTIVLREVLQGRVRSARPLRVIEDGPTRFVGYLVPGSTVAWPRLIGEDQSQTPDQGWRLPLERWFGPGSLFVVPAGAGFSAVLFFDPNRNEPTGWKVDFFEPLHRHPFGFDTLDHAFDLLADVDAAGVQAKDLDDLAQLRRLRLLAGPERDAFDAERHLVERLLATRSGPFGEGWTDWRPDPRWPPLTLPPGWADVRDGDDRGGRSPLSATVTGNGWRSAQGIRLLDGNGAVQLDVDLAGGSLWHGHAHPRIVDALSRQLRLGWQLGAEHPALDALQRRLLQAAPPGWELRWRRPTAPEALTGSAGDVADLDRALLAGWPFDAAGVCATAQCRSGVFGRRLFGGFPFAAELRPASDGDAALEADGEKPAPGEPPDALAALTALETLDLADGETIRQTSERAERLRRATGLRGEGGWLIGPPGWRAGGVVVPAGGHGLLATCCTDDDEAELLHRLRRWTAT